jgi:dolichol-phosphate mannosyltransferase
MSLGKGSEHDFTIILPTLNEGENIEAMVETLASLYPGAHILVMDDNSKDGTAEKARNYFNPPHEVEAIVRDPEDKGLTASVIEGISRTRTEYFIVLDADFQHPPEAIAEMMASLKGGKDLAIGVRKDKMNLMFFRKLASGGAHGLAKAYLTVKRQPTSRDTMSGFFGGRSEIFQKVIAENGERFERKGFKVLFDLLKFAPRGITVGEVLFTFNARRGGESKLNSRIILSILRQCGVGGKVAASAATFFFMSALGRLSAAVLFGLLSTFAVISLVGGDAWTGILNEYTFLSLVLALMYMVVTSEMIMKWRGERIIRGLSLISVAFSAYLLSLAIFFLLAAILPEVLMVSSLLGLAIAFSYDTALGFKKNHPVMVQ